VPDHLKDASLDGKEFGHGKGYKYPHDFENHFVEQKYFDDPVEFYVPTNQGYEVKIGERLNKIRKK
ncbi:MAG: hypothetical protein PHI20_02945, partial [Endomicrobiaceae bacterium]|nr:hypothetical protein [Endomicrobiaceae bacterium]